MGEGGSDVINHGAGELRLSWPRQDGSPIQDFEGRLALLRFPIVLDVVAFRQ